MFRLSSALTSLLTVTTTVRGSAALHTTATRAAVAALGESASKTSSSGGGESAGRGSRWGKGKGATQLLAAAGIAISATSLAATHGHAHAEASEGQVKDSSFYPPIEPFAKEFIKVDDRHTLYYHCYGNPKGKPVLFVHGGPGGGTDPTMARFFDPKVILAA